ncbi:MAG: YegP family protein, partial [Enterobacter ludwigii]|nr:YegP family protein [Enterobacter ludwigii]
MSGWFELNKSSDGQFRFVLKAGNGETILTSELYTTKNSAENGIASVRTNSPSDERYEKKVA